VELGVGRKQPPPGERRQRRENVMGALRRDEVALGIAKRRDQRMTAAEQQRREARQRAKPRDPLARLEARVAFEELFSCTTELHPAAGVERLDSLFLRGLRHLPLAFASVPAGV